MKILLISHDATRTGAPILLINLAKLLLEDEENSVAFLLKEGGVLESDFAEIAPVFLLKKNIPSSRSIFKTKKSIAEDGVFLNNFDLIISNTITNGDLLKIIRQNYTGKIISYIHELEIAAKAFTNEASILKLIESSTSFWVPSSIVNKFLVERLNIPQEKVFVMPYYIPKNETELKLEKKPKKEFVIGGCGTTDWRKGADLFIVIVSQLFIKYPNLSIVFRWAGVSPGLELERLKYQLRSCGMEDKVIFQLSSSDLSEFYNNIDLFLLPSREDPYPLVILEAAKFSVPSICFDNVCGSKDFILNSNGGTIVPFLDIDAVVETIAKFYNDFDSLDKMGENANNYLTKTHSNPKFVYEKFKEILNK